MCVYMRRTERGRDWGGGWLCDHPKRVTGYWQCESEVEDEEEEDEKRGWRVIEWTGVGHRGQGGVWVGGLQDGLKSD